MRIEFLYNVKELIGKNLNEKGKLTCRDAYKISAKTKKDINDIGKIVKEMNVRIDECDLGQFGGLDKSKTSPKAKENLQKFTDKEQNITCKDAREAAKGVGLKSIRGTLKKERINVTFCELGCFKQKKGKRMRVRTKTWIEDGEGNLLFGKGKTEVLELIEKTGSIVGASKEIGINYKKTWGHIKVLERNVEDEMVKSKQGGQGGSTLTPIAKDTIKKFKELQEDIEAYANERFKEIFLIPRNK